MSQTDRHGRKQLLAYLVGASTSSEVLCEWVAEGLARVGPGHVSPLGRADWQPWRVSRQIATDSMAMGPASGPTHELAALKFGAMNTVQEHGAGRLITQLLPARTSVEFEAFVGFDPPIDEHVICLSFKAHPGWMALGSEMLVHQTIVAIGDAIANGAGMARKPMFQFSAGGWSNVRLAALGTVI